MSENFVCSIPSCGFAAPADRMWNLDRKATGGQLVVLCGKDAHAARKEGLRAYRLAETMRRDAEFAAAKRERAEFFARFGKVRLADAFSRNGGARSATSSRQIEAT